MANTVIVWTEPSSSIVPRNANTALAIASVAQSLSIRDQKQIVTAFKAESFEMMAGFVLNKALSQLKRALASLGMAFVGEMLGRADLDEDSVPTVSISNFEAITLARELGLVNSTDAKRLTQHLELLAHLDGLDPESANIEEMTREEAMSFLRTCVNAVLGKKDNIAPVEFVSFRTALESRTFKSTDSEIGTLRDAPYFFKKTTLSILLAGAKTKSGAPFEHTLGNIVVIIPALWPMIRESEKWAVGQAYAEVVSSGNSAAMLALKKALSGVGGFDFVPETLRSQTFSSAASNLISVHTAMNNFYNEPSAVSALAKLGTTIPWPAFPICMSAILAVVLGNGYGRSNAAQAEASALLRRLTANQWDYYLNECLRGDELILQKLAWHERAQANWCSLVRDFELSERQIRKQSIQRLITASTTSNLAVLASRSEELLESINKET